MTVTCFSYCLVYIYYNNYRPVLLTCIHCVPDGHPPPDRTEEKPVLRVLSMGLFLSMCGLAAIGIMAGIGCLIFNIVNIKRR